jgi:hypothetical protein
MTELARDNHHPLHRLPNFTRCTALRIRAGGEDPAKFDTETMRPKAVAFLDRPLQPLPFQRIG